MSQTSGNNAVTLGETGRIVAANVKRLREMNKFSFAKLESHTLKAGRRIPAISIRRIEDGTRRVDTDDLFALAIALGVPPIQLLTGGGEKSPYGTCVPEDVTYAEFYAWLRGALDDFNTSSRFRYWSQQEAVWKQRAADARTRSNKLDLDADRNPEDKHVQQMAAYARSAMVRNAAAHEEALVNLERTSPHLDGQLD